jgi:hypothetical protein
MALPLPQLDNLTYTDLVEQARIRIPTLYPAWTDHNPTDPGMVLLEMLAWLTEMLLYRVNQITEAHVLSFLQLLNGPGPFDDSPATALPSYLKVRQELQQQPASPFPEPALLQEAIRETLLRLHERYRAATAADFVTLVLQQWPQTSAARQLGTEGVVKRALCLPQRHLERQGQDRLAAAPGHVSVILIPDTPAPTPTPTPALCQAVWRFLEPRRLLTTRHHVVGPDYLPVSLIATLYIEADRQPQSMREQAVEALRNFFHPLPGPTGPGWPFGRDVYVSEIYDVLARLPGVDFVDAVHLQAPGHPDREWKPEAQQPPQRIRLEAHELVAVEVTQDSFTIMAQRGGTWQKTTA